MRKASWVCFACREAVRRPVLYTGDVPCPKCKQACTCLFVPIPAKRDVRVWGKLQEKFRACSIGMKERSQTIRARTLHDLELKIAELEAQPSNEDRANNLQALRKRLAEMRNSAAYEDLQWRFLRSKGLAKEDV